MDYDFEPQRNPYVRKIALVVTIALVASVVAAFTKALFDSSSADRWVPVGTVVDLRRAGVTYHTDARTFVVADGDRFLALSAVNPHLSHLIRYCESSQWFEDPAHGEKFDRLGFYRYGPAPRGMDRVAFKVDSGQVYIDPTVITEGPAPGAGKGPEPVGSFCVESDVGEGSPKPGRP